MPRNNINKRFSGKVTKYHKKLKFKFTYRVKTHFRALLHSEKKSQGRPLDFLPAGAIPSPPEAGLPKIIHNSNPKAPL